MSLAYFWEYGQFTLCTAISQVRRSQWSFFCLVLWFQRLSSFWHCRNLGGEDPCLIHRLTYILDCYLFWRENCQACPLTILLQSRRLFAIFDVIFILMAFSVSGCAIYYQWRNNSTILCLMGKRAQNMRAFDVSLIKFAIFFSYISLQLLDKCLKLNVVLMIFFSYFLSFLLLHSNCFCHISFSYLIDLHILNPCQTIWTYVL